MVIFKKAKDLQNYLSGSAGNSLQTGFIPTMGALHMGHISLVERAKNDGCLSICSIFVNPTQFNDRSDFEKYPISIEADIALLLDIACDVLFIPSVEEIYPNGISNSPSYNFGYLDTILEGTHRPGHFKGVGMVVSRLLEIVQPNVLYLGQKDYQQCMVIQDLLKQLHKTEQIRINICPTLREADGLAMSSRNRRLTEPQRNIAGAIYQCLISIQSKKSNTAFSIVQRECAELLKDKGFVPEYIALADARDLSLMDDYVENTPLVALIAAKLGDIRLIDNLLLD